MKFTRRHTYCFIKRRIPNLSSKLCMNRLIRADHSTTCSKNTSWVYSSNFYKYYRLYGPQLSYRNSVILVVILVVFSFLKNLYVGLEGSKLSKFYRRLWEADRRTFLSLIMPPRTVSKVVYFLSTVDRPEFVRRFLLRNFIDMAEIDLSDSEKEILYDYRNVQELFTRNLKAGSRTVDKDAMLVSPCDGTVVNFGAIENDGFIFEYIKDQPVSLCKLYGSNEFPKMKNGNKLFYVILYLAPHNYHRFHSPADWNIEFVKRIKGLNKSVSISFLTMLPGYTCKNERVILEGIWDKGYLCMIPIAAMNVGGIEISKLQGYENIPSVKWDFKGKKDTAIKLDKGMELGKFLLGSSIVLLFEAPEEFNFAITNEQKVICGQKL